MVKLEAIDKKGVAVFDKDGKPFTKEFSHEQAEKLLQISNSWRIAKESDYVFTDGHLVSKEAVKPDSKEEKRVGTKAAGTRKSKPSE